MYKKAPIRISKDDFVISLSLRLKNEGHIFLCENGITNSRCYWIALQAWKGNASAIRRCETNYVPFRDQNWAEGDCKILRDSFVRKILQESLSKVFKRSLHDISRRISKFNILLVVPLKKKKLNCSPKMFQ